MADKTEEIELGMLSSVNDVGRSSLQLSEVSSPKNSSTPTEDSLPQSSASWKQRLNHSTSRRRANSSLGTKSSAKDLLLGYVEDAFVNAEGDLRRHQSTASTKTSIPSSSVVSTAPPPGEENRQGEEKKASGGDQATIEMDRRTSFLFLNALLDDEAAPDPNGPLVSSETSTPSEGNPSDHIFSTSQSTNESVTNKHMEDMRQTMLQHSKDGTFIELKTFKRLFADADEHLVHRIWEKYAVPYSDDGGTTRMIAIDQVCNVWSNTFSETTSSSDKRLDFLVELLDTDCDGNISKDEFVDFLEQSTGDIDVQDKTVFRICVDEIYEEFQEEHGEEKELINLTYQQVRTVLSRLGLDKLMSKDGISGHRTGTELISGNGTTTAAEVDNNSTTNNCAGETSQQKEGEEQFVQHSIQNPMEEHHKHSLYDVSTASSSNLMKMVLSEQQEKSYCCECCTSRHIRKNTSRIVWMIFFFGGLACSMIYKYWRYCNTITNSGPHPEFGWSRPDVKEILGLGVCFARSGSQGSMWCVMCLLWPICRGFLVKMRAIPGLWRIIPFDDRILFHTTAAWSLLFTIVVHVVAHLYNYSRYHVAPEEVWNRSVLGLHSGLDAQPAYWEVALKTLPGLTGHIMLLIVIIAYSFVLPPDFKINCSRSKRSTHASTTCCSNDKIKCCKPCADPSGFIHITKFNCNRKKPPNNKKTTPYKRTCLSVLCCSDEHIRCCRCCVSKDGHCNISGRDACYNAFWCTHQLLWTVFLVCFIIHGMGEWLEPSLTWLWVVLPLTVYVIERSWKACNPNRHSKIVDAKILNKGKVVCLVIERTRSLKVFKPGMYISIKIPALSNYQWHPFSISSAPSWEDEKHLTLHIQGLGDWTNELIERIRLIQTKALLDNDASSIKSSVPSYHDLEHMNLSIASSTHPNIVYPSIQIDGPFGAPTEAWRNFEVLLLVGAGIGVTPFMSVLKEITCMWKETRVPPEIGEHIRNAQNALEELKQLQAVMMENGGSVLGAEDGSESNGGGNLEEKQANKNKAYKERLDALILQVREELEIGLNKSNETIYPRTNRVRKLYFHFITRGQHSLMWFGNELQRVAAVDPESRIKIHMHLTRTQAGKSPFQMRLLRLAEQAGRAQGVDVISNLKHAKTSLGRPNWDQVFNSICQQHKLTGTPRIEVGTAQKRRPAKRIGVFFCGPEAIRVALEKKCIAYSHIKDVPDFILHSEKF